MSNQPQAAGMARAIGFFLLCVPLCGGGVLAEVAGPTFRAQTIDDAIEIGYGVAAADVDGDGHVDILLADKRQVVWYRNPTWEKFILAENLTDRDNVCIAAQDLDGDGKCEIAVGADWAPNDRENSGAVFYLIPPADRTRKWEPLKLHAEPTVHRMRWLELGDGKWGLVVQPLHGRGSDPAATAKLLLYHMPDDPRTDWPTELLDDSMQLTHNLHILPRKPAMILAGKQGLLQITREQGQWHKQWIVQSERGAGEVTFVGLGYAMPWPVYATIEPMHGNELVVYEPARGEQFQRTVLTDRLHEGHAIAFLRPNAIIAGWRGGGGGVVMFTKPNARLPWHETIIDDGGMACEDLCQADLDGDGDLEIIASGRATRNVKIYWNQKRE
jgi:hypothetical protein